MTQSASLYPAHWESEVSLHAGDTVHLRPIRPEDDERLEAFYQGVSQRAKRFRFFSSMPPLSENYISRLTHVDYHDRVVLVVTLGDQIIAVGQYALTAPGSADTALLVQDQHEGRGIGQLLMAHLAQIASECGVQRFTAEVMAENHRMIQIMGEQLQFERADQAELHRGIVYLEFAINDLTNSSARAS